jgi:hypothetical protein
VRAAAGRDTARGRGPVARSGGALQLNSRLNWYYVVFGCDEFADRMIAIESESATARERIEVSETCRFKAIGLPSDDRCRDRP